jgi:hypothetical protein
LGVAGEGVADFDFFGAVDFAADQAAVASEFVIGL